MQSSQRIKMAAVGAIAVKLLVMPIGSYPFDFATYVYQARSFFEYGITPLFFWNKGFPLLGLFIGQYSIYQTLIQKFAAGVEHTALLHIIFKLPFLAADLLSATIIAAIVLHLTASKPKASLAAIAWLCNPFVLWIVEFQGQYAIIATAFSLAALAALLKNQRNWSMICLAIATSVYYYPAIFLPFFLLKLGNWREAAKALGVFIGVTFLCYLPFLFTPHVIGDLAGSLIHHSAPDNIAAAKAITLPNYSLLNAPYSWLTGALPTSQTASWVLKAAGLLTYVGILIVAGYFIRRFKRVADERSYTDQAIVNDLLFVLSIFLLFIGKFQDHYFIWVIPFMIIVGIVTKGISVLQASFLIGIAAILLALGVSNIGVDLLDVLPFGTINFYTGMSPYVQALGGFSIVLLLTLNLAVALKPPKQPHEITSNRILAFVTLTTFGVIAYLALYTHVAMAAIHSTPALGSDSIVYSYPFSPKNFETTNHTTTTTPLAVPDPQFLSGQARSLTPNTYISSNEPWFFYSFGRPGAISAQIADSEPTPNSKSFVFTVNGPGGRAELNMGSNNSPWLVPISSLERYQASAMIQASTPSRSFDPTIRFANGSRQIIPGSDVHLMATKNTSGNWRTYTVITEPPVGTAFAEFKLDITSKVGQAGQTVAISDFTMSRYRDLKTAMLTALQPNDHADSIENYLLGTPAASYFHYDVTMLKVDKTQRLNRISLGTCPAPTYIRTQITEIIARFPSNCLNTTSHSLKAEVLNFASVPNINVVLTHDVTLTHPPSAHPELQNLIAIVAGITNLIVLTIVWFVARIPW